MDSITNGLDSATAFDIIQAMRMANHIMDTTMVISLLQVRALLFFISNLISSMVDVELCHSLHRMFIACLMK